MDCSRKGCRAPAIIDQPYAGAHLCRAHFSHSVVERVRRELHHQAPRLRGGVLAVALSGGKDSAVLLTLVHRLLSERRGIRIVALSIDEGIEGYRTATLAPARKLCSTLGVEHKIVSFRDEMGFTTDQAAAAQPGGSPCSCCGVWRRGVLNRAARDMGAVRLALGFNLDDLAQTVLMNIARGEPARLRQMAPHAETRDGLVPRLAPLAMVPEREVYVYARLHDVPFDHTECPHAGEAGRNVYREVVWRLEEAFPGTRHALLRSREKLLPALQAADPDGAPGSCVLCGEPASGELCRACEYRHRLQELSQDAFILPAGSGRV